MNNETTTTPEKLKKLVASCDFLDEKDREKWTKKAERLSGNALEFVFKKFKDAKNRVETIYMTVALQHDPTNGDLIREALATIQKSI